MKRTSKTILIFAIALITLLPACTLWQAPPLPTSTPTATLAATATELPTAVPPTNTPLPTQTYTVAPSATVAIPTLLPPTATSTVGTTTNTEYSCDIIDQSPSDDTKYTSGDDFDISWTLINIGTEQWKDGTILKYQTGPHMTTQTKVALPRLKPDETFVVSFDAKASGKSGSRQVMLWAVIGPGKTDANVIWMCYPYTRIVIK